MSYSGTSNGTSYNTTAMYTTVYDSASTYKINMTFTYGSTNETSTIWILKNGTTLAVDEAGYNLTGAMSSEIEVGFFAGFSAEAGAAAQLSTYTASNYFHSTGTSSVTIGSNTFKVTNYAANSLPETIMPCGGTALTLNTYTLAVGTPTGSTAPLVTLMQISGSEANSSGGGSTSISYTIQLTGLTVR
jgi:hypothetical protein